MAITIVNAKVTPYPLDPSIDYLQMYLSNGAFISAFHLNYQPANTVEMAVTDASGEMQDLINGDTVNLVSSFDEMFDNIRFVFPDFEAPHVNGNAQDAFQLEGTLLQLTTH